MILVHPNPLLSLTSDQSQFEVSYCSHYMEIPLVVTFLKVVKNGIKFENMAGKVCDFERPDETNHV